MYWHHICGDYLFKWAAAWRCTYWLVVASTAHLIESELKLACLCFVQVLQVLAHVDVCVMVSVARPRHDRMAGLVQQMQYCVSVAFPNLALPGLGEKHQTICPLSTYPRRHICLSLQAALNTCLSWINLGCFDDQCLVFISVSKALVGFAATINQQIGSKLRTS